MIAVIIIIISVIIILHVNNGKKIQDKAVTVKNNTKDAENTDMFKKGNLRTGARRFPNPTQQ